jgi:TatD DNase family protein
MFLVDSHCHLDRIELERHGGSLANALDAARANGVGCFLNVNIDLEHEADVRTIAEQHADVWFSVGVHPSEQEGEEPTLERLVALAAHPKCIAIGETGLDYHWCKGDTAWQRERFRVHLRAAHAVRKPVIVHTREARADTLRILAEENVGGVGGIMHCFTEDLVTAQAAVELGMHVSFSGIVSFRNAEPLREVARTIPLERLLVETDSPYLAPVPHRGKSNEPAWVRDVAACVAKERGLTSEALAQATTENFFRLFPAARPR